MDSINVLTFLGGLRDVRELISALTRYCTYDGLRALEFLTGSRESSIILQDEITSDMLLIAVLCSRKDLGDATFHHLDPVTDVGKLALQRIGTILLRTSHLDERQLTIALAASTVRNVLAARQLCLVALQGSLSPGNCFRIFRFADECGIAPLRQAAEQVCLASFPRGDTGAQDFAGFTLLNQDQLQSLLQSDALQVDSELDVFRVIVAWVHACSQERMQLMAILVQRCVRLGAMDLRQLEQLDQDPHVIASREVTCVVAQAYVMRIMCRSVETTVRLRDSVARAAAKAEAERATMAWAVAGEEMWATAGSDVIASSRSGGGEIWAH
ncbi:hypothetical protein Vretimale_19432 [Volvox reticuliferus]|uniref:BACK domain-containing protein n=1 Tax=Volvox reticuliferus TaxID=1737510 RepID=A0A8J4D0U4_9CHLO|nr:hypothetical protein Vretifemale_20202 [Volvox reticuliferus]GIM16847.1 hypothetical protein Vretimale_19432 [Volvox reticuliferus]